LNSNDSKREAALKVLVTGGAGFIGSNVVRSLLLRGDSVRVLDNFSSGKRENLEEMQQDLELMEGDIQNLSSCLQACEGIEAVLHQAALGSVIRSVQDPLLTHAVNVTGTLNVLLAARDMGVRRFVFASSSSVYGNAPEKVKVETLPLRPLSPYAVSKMAGEAYTLVFSRVYGLEAISLRYFNVFGPRQDPLSTYAAVVPSFAASLLAEGSPKIFGDGQQTRDFTYVENVVRANLLALECPAEACGRAYNIACGRSTSVNELFRLMRERIGGDVIKVKATYEPPLKGDVRESLASNEAARETHCYMPTIAIEEGIALTVDWYRSRFPEPRAANSGNGGSRNGSPGNGGASRFSQSAKSTS
jgi:nucleoside-diphosphate-sugar epimerase